MDFGFIIIKKNKSMENDLCRKISYVMWNHF